MNSLTNYFADALKTHARMRKSTHTYIRKYTWQILLHSPATGPACVYDPKLNHIHMINHFEYDVDTLNSEYVRDLKKGTPTGEMIHIPHAYYPEDDPSNTPEHTVCSLYYVRARARVCLFERERERESTTRVLSRG